jgi:hypothetical protein
MVKYMVMLPDSLRDELATQFHWIDGTTEMSGRVLSVLHKIPFLCDLDTLSAVHICAHFKYVVQRPVVEELDGSKSNFIMTEGEVGQEMFTIIKGARTISGVHWCHVDETSSPRFG